MVAVNNRLFQKTNKQKTLGSYEKECKQTVDHMKKNSRKTRDLHIFREDWKRSHIYNTILWQRTKKI